MKKTEQPKRKKLASPLSRLSSPKHQARAAEASKPAPPAPAPAPLPRALPAAMPKPVDPLAAVVAKREEVARAAACFHKHLKFLTMGSMLGCVDCARVWHILLPGGGTVPDLAYFHPVLNEMETRHTPYEAPRNAPLPPPPTNK